MKKVILSISFEMQLILMYHILFLINKMIHQRELSSVIDQTVFEMKIKNAMKEKVKSNLVAEQKLKKLKENI